MSEFVKAVSLQPAWDKRHAPDGKNYGVGGVQIDFTLVGPLGAVYFALRTKWYLPEIDAYHERLATEFPNLRHAVEKPYVMPVSVHSRTPRPDWNYQEHCGLLLSSCWMESPGLTSGDPIYEKLLRHGDAALWTALEEFYHKFLEEKWQDVA